MNSNWDSGAGAFFWLEGPFSVHVLFYRGKVEEENYAFACFEGPSLVSPCFFSFKVVMNWCSLLSTGTWYRYRSFLLFASLFCTWYLVVEDLSSDFSIFPIYRYPFCQLSLLELVKQCTYPATTSVLCLGRYSLSLPSYELLRLALEASV
jgi:hypothetical protein